MSVAPRKPDWLKIRPPGGERYQFIKQRLRELGLHTVCEEAHCPNVSECWGGGTATFMLMGDVCTRGCRFCAVNTNRKGAPLDPEEPRKVAEVIGQLDLDYVVITSVDRDDLPDGGAAHFAECIRHLKAERPELLVEVLIPDFRGDRKALAAIAEAAPDVIAHNVETVRRLTPGVRDPRATYDQSLEVLDHLDCTYPATLTKSSLMLGLGETEAEVREAIADLRAVGCDVLTFGQYLQPSARHLPVAEYLSPEVYDRYRELGEEAGFLYVASGPLVRSSYRAGELLVKGLVQQRRVAASQV